MMANFVNRKIIFIFSLVVINYVVFESSFLYLIIFFLSGYSLFQFFEHFYQQKVVTAEFDSGLIYAPVSGEVVSIQKSEKQTQVTIKPKWYHLASICFPSRGEIMSLGFEKSEAKIHEYSERLNLVIKCPNMKLELLMPTTFYVKNDLLIRQGDVGDAGAIFSYLPFNGILDVVLPAGVNINIDTGDNVVMGRTALTSLE